MSGNALSVAEWGNIPAIDGARLAAIEAAHGPEEALHALIQILGELGVRDSFVSAGVLYTKTITGGYSADIAFSDNSSIQAVFPRQGGEGETSVIGMGKTQAEAATQLLRQLRDPALVLPDFARGGAYDPSHAHLRILGTQKRFAILNFV